MYTTDAQGAQKMASHLTALVIQNNLISTHTHGKDLAKEIIDFYRTIESEFSNETKK